MLLQTSTSLAAAAMFDFIPEDQRSHVKKEVLCSLVADNPDGVLAMMAGEYQSDGPGFLELLAQRIAQCGYTIPPNFIKMFVTPPAPKPQPTSSKEQVMNSPAHLSRHATERLRKELLSHSFQKGPYPRYECTNKFCKTCRYLYVLYPISKCSKLHPKSEPCNALGMFPHISKQKWIQMHTLRRVPERFPVGIGCCANPLGMKSLAQMGRIISMGTRRKPMAAVATETAKENHPHRKTMEEDRAPPEVSSPDVASDLPTTPILPAKRPPAADTSSASSSVSLQKKKRQRRVPVGSATPAPPTLVPGMPTVEEAYRMLSSAKTPESERISHGLLMEAL